MKITDLYEDNILDAIAAHFGSAEAEGRMNKSYVVKEFVNRYKAWATSSNQKPAVDNVVVFMINKLGFNEQDTVTIFHKANIDSGSLNNSQIQHIFTIAAEYSFEHGLIDVDKSEAKGQAKSDKEERSIRYKRDQGTGRATGKENTKDSGKAENKGDVFSLNQTQLTAALKTVGLDREYVNDISDIIAKTKNIEDLKTRPDQKELMRQLAKMGYALFKAMDKA